MRFDFKHSVIIGLFAVAAVTSACKGKTGKSGSPTPTPTPGASATPVPSPSPTEKYPGLPAACQALPNGTGSASGCTDADDHYDSSFKFVDAARTTLGELSQAHPEYFEADGETVKSAQWDSYIKTFMKLMSDKGICAVHDGFYMYVRDARNLNESFYMSSGGKARTFAKEKCSPARPMPAFFTSPPANDPWCPLPNSPGNGSCGGGSTWLSNVDTMLRNLIAEEKVKGASSTILDTSKLRAGDELGYAIKSKVLFFRRLIDMAHQMNLCAYSDYYDSLFLKSPTGNNSFSDVYDLVFDGANGEVTTRSPGFSGRCSPAEF